MSQAIRDLKKRGAKNRIINDSVNAMLAIIMENRQIKKEQEAQAREAAKNAE